VVLERHLGHIQLTVEDDGRGFEPTHAPTTGGGSRLGLLGIRERTELAGGTMDIESTPGGTTVFVRLPLEQGPHVGADVDTNSGART
jgi:signal transduction histidine kinase